MKKIYFIFIFLISIITFGQVLSDDFNNPDNSLLSANGWTAFSGAGNNSVDVGASNGLIYAGYSGTSGFTGVAEGNAARLDNTGEDVNKTFTSVTSGTLYYSFLLNVSAAVNGYFAGLNTTGTNFGNRVFIKPSGTAGKYNIGISNSSTATYGTTAFDIGTTYLVIVKYDVSTTGSTSIWVKSSGVPATEVDAGTAEASTSGSGSATISGFFLRQYDLNQNITIDGLRMYKTWFNTAACSLVLGTQATTCDATTYNLDTYTATVPFTGGGTATYSISSSSGTISGDNPSTTAAGNIIISGVTEGTDINLTITGGCTISKTITAPSCKPINTLPLSESFPYTVGNSLNGEQKWRAVNTGDNITVSTGSLSYTGITSSGNSISFSGAGAESLTPFTATNSGVISAAFLFSSTDYSNVTVDLTNAYFALFTSDNAGASTSARIWVRKNGTQYQFGLGAGTSPDTWSENLYDVGTTQYLTLSYDFANNKLYLFENQQATTSSGRIAAAVPTVEVSPTTAFSSLGGFMLRQDAANNTPTIVIDEISINTNPLSTLAISDINSLKARFIKNTVTNTEIVFGAKSTVNIYNMNGQIVKSANVENGTSLNIASLPKGTYIVSGEVEGKKVAQKIIKK